MKKTVELDDAEDLIESELEIFERESRGELDAPDHEQLIPPATVSRPGSMRSSLGGSLRLRDTIMMSKKTQTDPDNVKPLPPITRKTTSSNLLMATSVNNVRTLTRQLKTGNRSTLGRTLSKKFKPPVAAEEEGEEDEEDEFANLEAGNSKSRRALGRLAPAPAEDGLSSRLKKSFRSMKRQVTKPVLNLKGLGRTVNKRAKLSYIQLKIHDLKVAFERQRNERNEFWVFKKDIKAIQGELGSSTAALFLFVRYILMINLFSSLFWVFLVALPQAIYFNYSADTQVFVTLHLFLGTGRVASSWLFFSGYDEELSSGYKMYLAYLLVHFISIGGVFIGILKTIANDFIREGSSFRDQQNSLALNLFSSWDYSINSRSAIKEQMKSLESNFKDQICELTSMRKERTVKELRIMYALRTLAWVIWVLLIAGAIAGIIATINWANSQTDEGFVTVYGPTLALTAINGAVPFFMQKLTLLEQYDNGRQEQYFTIFRVYIMRMISLLTFIITLIKDSEGECKQLYWGQEFYKLCIINTFTNVASLLKYAAFAYLLGTKNEVDLPSSLMALIYFQGCIWFGNLFCPLLSLIASVSNVIYFMVGAVVVKKCCQPPTKRYNARNGRFFNSFLAFTVLIMIVCTCYLIVKMEVRCGPFAKPKFNTIFDSFTVISSEWSSGVNAVLAIILSGPVVVALIFILFCVIYFLDIINQKRKVRDRILMEEIKLLQKEKTELMKERLKRNSPTI